MSARAQKTSAKQWVTIPCDCSPARKGQYLAHYEIVECGNCGSKWWVLQPQKDGPLVARPWPGRFLIPAEPGNRPEAGR